MSYKYLSITKEELDAALVEHNLWLKSDGNNGKRLSIPHRDLTGFDLSNMNFTKANLSYCQFIRVNLNYSKLIETQLTGTSIHYSCVAQADLSKADLTKASIRYVDLYNSNLERTILVDADLRDSGFKYVNLSYTDWTFTTEHNCNFNNANLAYSTFHKRWAYKMVYTNSF